MSEIRKYKRDCAFVELKDYCHLSKEDDYMEVSLWWNGEGFDVDVDGKKYISLTWGEFKALKKLIKILDE